mmetsp:Transcript_63317/g.73683  ORF Transcript_63317/g.73683 Transcript_63317/m.73683 type:complete len:89 (-) Transcript_63317:90-356(-)
MRLSFPFFLDPGFHATITKLPLSDALQREAADVIHRRAAIACDRWDNGKTLVAIEDDLTYGEYLLRKVGKVFPELAEKQQIQKETSIS